MTIAGEGFQFDYTVNTLVMRAIANGNIVSALDSQYVALSPLRMIALIENY